MHQSNPKSKRRKLDTIDRGLQRRKFSMNECAVCCGLYEEDIDEESGDTVTGYNVPILTVLFGVM